MLPAVIVLPHPKTTQVCGPKHESGCVKGPQRGRKPAGSSSSHWYIQRGHAAHSVHCRRVIHSERARYGPTTELYWTCNDSNLDTKRHEVRVMYLPLKLLFADRGPTQEKEKLVLLHKYYYCYTSEARIGYLCMLPTAIQNRLIIPGWGAPHGTIFQ